MVKVVSINDKPTKKKFHRDGELISKRMSDGSLDWKFQQSLKEVVVYALVHMPRIKSGYFDDDCLMLIDPIDEELDALDIGEIENECIEDESPEDCGKLFREGRALISFITNDKEKAIEIIKKHILSNQVCVGWCSIMTEDGVEVIDTGRPPSVDRTIQREISFFAWLAFHRATKTEMADDE